jgi:transposase-like protein
MSDRFYKQQLASTGNCPGASLSQQRRKRKMAWDDEKKAQAVQMYLDGEPTPDNSMEIVKEIAETLEESPNGVRMILTKAEVYVKKAPATKSASSGSSTGGGRVSKAAAQEALVAAITDTGQAVDDEIISKMTGKAAQYFTTVLSAINS